MQITFVSCVNNFAIYNADVVSSLQNQQGDIAKELIPVDNTSSNLSAAAALNQGLQKATGEIIVFCHQDVIFSRCWLCKLLKQISLVEHKYKRWGVLGTGGIAIDGTYSTHIIDPHGYRKNLPLPRIVQSLDEHCLIIRRDSGLSFDEELGGFHLYGVDLCLQAELKGLKNFAIDACLKHLSGGKLDSNFYEVAERLYGKWRKRNCPRSIIETTCGIIRLQDGLRARLAYMMARGKKACRGRWWLLTNRRGVADVVEAESYVKELFSTKSENKRPLDT